MELNSQGEPSEELKKRNKNFLRELIKSEFEDGVFLTNYEVFYNDSTVLFCASFPKESEREQKRITYLKN